MKNIDKFNLTEECKDSLVIEVACTLIKYVMKNGDTITYGELVKKAGLDISPRMLECPLGCISEACIKNGVPPISVMVVNKETSIPGRGFFRYFYPYLKEDEWDEKFIELFRQVRRYKNWKKVLKAFE